MGNPALKVVQIWCSAAWWHQRPGTGVSHGRPHTSTGHSLHVDKHASPLHHCTCIHEACPCTTALEPCRRRRVLLLLRRRRRRWLPDGRPCSCASSVAGRLLLSSRLQWLASRQGRPTAAVAGVQQRVLRVLQMLWGCWPLRQLHLTQQLLLLEAGRLCHARWPPDLRCRQGLQHLHRLLCRCCFQVTLVSLPFARAATPAAGAIVAPVPASLVRHCNAPTSALTMQAWTGFSSWVACGVRTSQHVACAIARCIHVRVPHRWLTGGDVASLVCLLLPLVRVLALLEVSIPGRGCMPRLVWRCCIAAAVRGSRRVRHPCSSSGGMAAAWHSRRLLLRHQELRFTSRGVELLHNQPDVLALVLRGTRP